MSDAKNEVKQVDEMLVMLKTHKQEAIDCLIASRAAYEPTLDGVADVLERSYEVDTSRYELLYHREQSTFLSARLLDNQDQVYAIIRSSNNYVMVAFRGTFTVQDAIQDMKLTTAPVGFGKGRAHVGFRTRAENMPVQLFMNLPRPGEKLIFTGHSLGGAVASLTALRVLEEISAAGEDAPLSRDRVLCVTFGTAPFANRELAMYINSKYRDRFYHLVSRHDFVPRAHNILPRIFFPLAQSFSKNLRESAYLKTAQRLLETATGNALQKSILQLEDILRTFCLTGLIDFFKDCIANDEEALFYGLCGYVLLFNPDAKDSEHIVEVDQMENMTPGFCTEGKTTMEVLFEHGLGNHYSLILQGLFDKESSSKTSAKSEKSIRAVGNKKLNSSMRGFSTSIMPFLSDPASAFLFHVARLLLNLVNNDVPAAMF